jgi:hypothetical protein
VEQQQVVDRSLDSVADATRCVVSDFLCARYAIYVFVYRINHTIRVVTLMKGTALGIQHNVVVKDLFQSYGIFSWALSA